MSSSPSTSSNRNEFGVPSTASSCPKGKNLESPAPPPPEAAVLTLLNNNNNSIVKIPLDSTSLVHKDRNFLLVGRQASTCDIRITHKSLSRQHAVFYYDDDGQQQQQQHLILVDLGTKSGTFVNQQRIERNTPTILKDGDSIQFGKSQPNLVVEWKQEEGQEKDEQQQQQNDNDKTVIQSQSEDATATVQNDVKSQPELTGRAKRQAEIAAMMASLDDDPTYTKYVPTRQEREQQNQQQQQQHNNNNMQQQQQEKSALLPVLEKYRLPLHESTTPS